MEIILKEDVLNLGFKDDIVNVKNGYGRNFLIPQGKAILATTSEKKILSENIKQKAFKEWNNKSFPITEKIHAEVLSLPISSVQSIDNTTKIINILNKWY